MAAYNAEKTIADAVGSVFVQTLQPLELIVVDDGSKDATVAALEPWLDRLTLVRTPNRGVSAARNEAARHASGDFLALLDADDVFMPRRLEALGSLARARPDLDLLVTNLYYELATGWKGLFYVNRTLNNPGAPGRFPTDDQRAAIIKGSFPQHPGIRRTAFERHDGFDEGLVVAEDWDLWLRMILAGSRVGLADEPLMRYRQQRGGLTSNLRRLAAARLDVYTRVLARDDLTPKERKLAEAAARRIPPTLDLIDAYEAIARGDSDRRRRAFSIAKSGEQPLSTRIKAGFATLFPRVSTRILARQAARRAARSSPPLVELAEAYEAIARGDSDRRRRAFSIARSGEQPLSTRLKAGFATLFPRVSTRILARQATIRTGALAEQPEGAARVTEHTE